MEPDFSGWATKSNLKCSDGRTILPNAFAHQDKMQVPLVWQHDHKDPENVLGHVILENRAEGVYCKAYFNDTKKAVHARGIVSHKDVTMLSIWANNLIESAKRVSHGVIREVSLVLAGANPGARIENVVISHGDGSMDELDDEAIIFTGLEFEHSVGDEDADSGDDSADNADSGEDSEDGENDNADNADGDEDVQHSQSGMQDATVQGIYDTMTEEQQQVVALLVGEALASVQHDNIGDADEDNQEGNEMAHKNVFEKDGEEATQNVISHDDMAGIVEMAARTGSFKHAVKEYALAHNIDDIDVLFPDAKTIGDTPEYLKRRVEWVNAFLGATAKTPFNRIKTRSADITFESARAKGYVTGSMKKEEFFRLAKRTTQPTTVYKKQALDRDDVVDITDFDVVTWLKAEMRIMLDEEVARAGLLGDGRDISDEDKIDEQCIRPIATDSDLFVTTIIVNLVDDDASIQNLIDAVVTNRKYYKGTGTPNFYTTETVIAQALLLKDAVGRRLYTSLADLATELRVSAIVPVEPMEEDDELVGIIVNPVDYVYGATAGGEVNMFDDFDIDYNKQKYLIETRLCGALTKMKSAIVIRQAGSGDVAVVPNAPTFDPETGHLTIVNTTHVVYKNSEGTTVNAGGSPYTVPEGEYETITATAAAGYYIESSAQASWKFRTNNS